MVAANPSTADPHAGSTASKTARKGSGRRSADRNIGNPTVSVVIPTFNEASNLPVLVRRLENVLNETPYELIVVDDNSPDETWKVGQELAEDNRRIRVIRRMDTRGLSSAVMAGFAVAQGETLAVLDSDLQHDERILPQLVSLVVKGDADVAVGSREAEGGSYGNFAPHRRFISWGGAQLARTMLGIGVDDPMSGFFVLSRARYESVVASVNPRGFKILLEFLANGPKPQVAEVGYTFRDRIHGTTKLTSSVAASYLLALMELSFGRFVTATFSAYALVGVLGLMLRLSVEAAATTIGISAAATIALEVSIISNYAFNNVFTFAAYRHRGPSVISGLIKFHLVAGYGLLVAIGIQSFVDGKTPSSLLWDLVGLVCGVLVATVGNYLLNSSITWKVLRS
jgi:dolichol-phosphate mannosyltransferase